MENFARAKRREEGDQGWEGEVRGGRERGLPPVHPLISGRSNWISTWYMYN